MLNFATFFPHGCREDQFLQGSGYYFYGVRRGGKSSFAFQAAINTVLDGGTVLALCHEQCVSRKVPQPFTSLAALSMEELNRLEFAYVSDWESAIKELLDIDESGSEDENYIPDLIILEDDGWNSVPIFTGYGEGDRRSRGLLDGLRATCLSILVNLRNRMLRSRRNFTFIVVSNHEPGIDYGGGLDRRLELPLSNFPLVHVQFSGTGVVHVIPLACDTKATINSFSLEWNDGLQLCD